MEFARIIRPVPVPFRPGTPPRARRFWAGGDATATSDDVLQQAQMAVARWITEELGG